MVRNCCGVVDLRAGGVAGPGAGRWRRYNGAATVRIRFGECTFDSEARQRRRKGAGIALTLRAFDLLRILIESRPRAIPQSELKDRLWPGSFVGRTSLAQLVTEVRKAIGDDPAEPRFVRTQHGFG